MTLETAIKKLRNDYERALSMPYVRKPLAYALYRVWREAELSTKERDTSKVGKTNENSINS